LSLTSANEKTYLIAFTTFNLKVGKDNDYEFGMLNSRVIRVKVVVPEKLLDVKTLPKNNPDVDFTIYVVSKYLCVDMASCDIQKYLVLI